ncbi:cupin domain-containing protein [Saccharobesus litoralis]|uniref:Cupin domain-containing protein n=1 Tax=Saccharobesus litoralis TaxID=2172099 RepID=A0A2S0VR15_9ALTE|nr:cupin domain-containing protein [Saccharobesus litoralis]AWB66656.1 cupin domain-containing protein [Saccharobesus litoralis]
MKYTHLNQQPTTKVSHNSAIDKQTMISSGQIDNLVYFSKACFPPGEIAAGHTHHDMTEVFFIDSGNGEFAINKQIIELTAGSCITIEPGDWHELRNTGDKPLKVTYFGLLTPVNC